MYSYSTQLALIFFSLLPFTILDEYMASSEYSSNCKTNYLSVGTFLLIAGLFKMGQLLVGPIYKYSQLYSWVIIILLVLIVASFGINIFGIILFADVYHNHNCSTNILVYTMFSICVDVLMLIWYCIFFILNGFDNDNSYTSLNDSEFF